MQKELRKLRAVKKKFSSLMKANPFDTWFDESILSKASHDWRRSLKEIRASKRVLQECLDTFKTRQAPQDLSSELFKFSEFPRIPPVENEVVASQNFISRPPTSQFLDLRSFIIEEKSVPDDEVASLAKKETGRLQFFTRLINSRQHRIGMAQS